MTQQIQQQIGVPMTGLSLPSLLPSCCLPFLVLLHQSIQWKLINGYCVCVCVCWVEGRSAMWLNVDRIVCDAWQPADRTNAMQLGVNCPGLRIPITLRLCPSHLSIEAAEHSRHRPRGFDVLEQGDVTRSRVSGLIDALEIAMLHSTFKPACRFNTSAI
jgi:hypothetical protein